MVTSQNIFFGRFYRLAIIVCSYGKNNKDKNDRYSNADERCIDALGHYHGDGSFRYTATDQRIGGRNMAQQDQSSI